MRTIGYVLLMAGLVLAATATDALAGGTVTVPEFNPSSVAGGLALLTGSVLLVRARRQK
jgi:hypothetical protein